jgi:hypothetical protein
MRAERWSLAPALAVMTGLCVAMVLSWPVFPSVDGPVHGYYATVIRSLLFEPESPFAGAYQVAKPLPPYLFHYAALVALDGWLDPAWAEKLLVAAYIVTSIVAARKLGGALGAPDPNVPALAALPFILNLSLLFGFLNFNFGCAIAAYLIGFSIERRMRFKGWELGWFALIFGLMASMHPVPVFIFLIFVALHAVVEYWPLARAGKWVEASRGLARNYWGPVAVALPIVVWVIAISTRKGDPRPIPPYGTTLTRVMEALSFRVLSPVDNHLYRYLELGLLLGAGLVARQHVRRFWSRDGVRPLAALWGVCVVLYLAAPDQMAGSVYFNLRFAVFAGLLLGVAAGCLISSLNASVLRLGGAAAVIGVSLLLFWRVNDSYGRFSRTIDRTVRSLPDRAAGSSGLLVAYDDPRCRDCSLNVLYHAGSHYFRRNQAILLNNFWVRLPISMIEVANQHSWDDLTPREMGRLLFSDADEKPPFDFVILEGDPSNSGVQQAREQLMSRYDLVSASPDHQWLDLLIRRNARSRN